MSSCAGVLNEAYEMLFVRIAYSTKHQIIYSHTFHGSVLFSYLTRVNRHKLCRNQPFDQFELTAMCSLVQSAAEHMADGVTLTVPSENAKMTTATGLVWVVKNVFSCQLHFVCEHFHFGVQLMRRSHSFISWNESTNQFNVHKKTFARNVSPCREWQRRREITFHWTSNIMGDAIN